MKILVVAPALPVPLNNGGAIRIFQLVRHLSGMDDVDLLAPDDGLTPEMEQARLRSLCGRVYGVVPRRAPWPAEAARLLRRTLEGEPFYTKYADRPEMRERLRQVTRATDYDLVILEHSHLAGLASAVCLKPGGRLVLASHNVAWDQFRRLYIQERHPVRKLKLLLTWLPMRRWESAALERFDAITTVTERDRQLYRSDHPALPVSVVPNGVDTEACVPLPREGRERGMLMVGSLDYAPNVDAALHLHGAILPLIRRELPDVRLTIAGRSPPRAIRRLHRPGRVDVCADPPELAPLYARTLVAPVALRAGGGSRLKILEAMAHGVPVVSTGIGCEGLPLLPEKDILIADAPSEFSRLAVRVMTRPDLWEALSGRGRALVQSQFDWKRITAGLRDVLLACLARPPSRKRI